MPLLDYTQECQDAAQGKWPASGHWTGTPTERRERPKNIRVFKNGFIETVFAKAHPVTPIIWFGPIIGYGFYRAVVHQGFFAAVGLFLLGWLAWTLLEYLLHRWVFHMEPGHTPETRFRSFMVHGYHHEFPSDKMRLVAPPLMSWPLGLVVGGLYYLAFPSVWMVLFGGTAAGYIAYDWIHYYTHHFRPTTAIGKWLKSYHLLHHFDDSQGHRRYGVSSPLWDFVFRTYAPVRKK